jgi:dTDP-glucose 4,6-dehydratase
MRNVLVTGGAGFIGSNFVRSLLATNSRRREAPLHVINLDALTYAGNRRNLEELPDPRRHTFIHGDVSDRATVNRLLHKHQVDTVVHFAAETHVDRSIHDPELFIRSNIIGTYTLLEAARQFWLVEKALPLDSVRFHHISTDEVYGTLAPHEPAFTEQTAYAPNSPYAASKAASDHLVRAYGVTYGLPATISNCSNNYGPYMYPEKLIPLMIMNALDGKPLPVYGDGQQIRDWLYVEDHCEAILAILDRGRPGETYNIGGGNQIPNLTVVQTLCAIMDELVPASPHAPHANLIRFVKDRPGHDRRYDVDIRKIHAELGWLPGKSLATGLRKTVAWYLEHPDWMAGLRGRADYQGWLQRNYAGRDDSQTGEE